MCSVNKWALQITLQAKNATKTGFTGLYKRDSVDNFNQSGELNMKQCWQMCFRKLG